MELLQDSSGEKIFRHGSVIYWENLTSVYRFDISDPENPVAEKGEVTFIADGGCWYEFDYYAYLKKDPLVVIDLTHRKKTMQRGLSCWRFLRQRLGLR
jgi:hypothetical protein